MDLFVRPAFSFLAAMLLPATALVQTTIRNAFRQGQARALRPRGENALQKFPGRFPAIMTFRVEDQLGGRVDSRASISPTPPATPRSA